MPGHPRSSEGCNPPLPERIVFRAGEAHIWSASLDVDTDELRNLTAALSPDERERAGRFALPLHAKRWIAARGVLRTILSHYTRVPPAALCFSYTEHGKPALLEISGGDEIRFNVSHTEDCALVAVTEGREIGVDIERVRDNPFNAAVARRFFAPGEQAALGSTPEAAWPAAFCTMWARKEACVKASGLGLGLPLRSFDVSRDARTPRIVVARGATAGRIRWTLVDIETVPGYAAACAVDGRGLKIVRWTFGA